MKRVIRLGDPTDHGGAVTGASATTSMFGKQVALIGDPVSCPKQGHVNCVIVEGDPSWTVGGRGVALEGHKVSCGATLISTMPEVGRSYEGSGAASSGHPNYALMAAAVSAAAIVAKLFNDKFQVIDEQTGKPAAFQRYAILRGNGELEHGETDADGHTHITSDEAESEEVSIYLEG